MSDTHRQTGHPMGTIAQRLRAAGTPAVDASGAMADRALQTTVEIDPHRVVSPDDPVDGHDGFPRLRLSAEMIAAPAFFVDPQLRVRWIATGSDDGFSHALAHQLASIPQGTIFNILTRPAVKAAVHGWQTLFAFIYGVLKRSTASHIFTAVTGAIEEAYNPASHPGHEQYPAKNDLTLNSVAVRFDGAAASPQSVFALGFKAGTLFLVRQAGAAPIPPENETTAATQAQSDLSPAVWRPPIGALSIRIGNAQRLAAVMMPGAFVDLVNGIWDAADDLCRSLGGKRIGASGGQAHYRFVESAGRNPIFSAIIAAMRLSRRLPALQADLLEELESITLQMGISSGVDDGMAIDSTGNIPLVIPGDAVDQASTLASIAGNGEIWITRAAIGHLPKALVDQLMLGIERQDKFIQNRFVRASALPWAGPVGLVEAERGHLFVTRILAIQPSTPDPPDHRQKA